MKRETSKDTKARLALKIMNFTKVELTLALPFMSRAFDALPFAIDLRTGDFGTDGSYIRLNPSFVMEQFLNDNAALRRGYLHSVIHCIFSHVYKINRFSDKDIFNLSCDIVSESIIDSMDNPEIYSISSEFRDETYLRLQENMGVLTVERLYHYFMENKPDYDEYARLVREFKKDDHRFFGDNKDKETPPENNNQESNLSEEDWKDMANTIEEEMRARADAGDEKGNLLRHLRAENKSKTNYKKLLEKYAITREEMKIDPDTFDYALYTYGLSLYGNMPLIEENEYSEIKKVDELVIAIDTSASCQGELVSRFLNEVYSMIKDSESFFKHTDILIIECDNQIQKTLWVTEPGQIKEYGDSFEVRGGYGTDLRPVFLEVDNLKSAGKLKNLKGLLYFTDGQGCYPKNPTSYETSFVLWKDRAEEEGLIPDWARILYFE